MMASQTYSSRGPIVIIGSGLAGLTCAWTTAPADCVLITAGSLTEGAASMWAQGGIAAALGIDDSSALHAEDTWRAGAFVGDRKTINRITRIAPRVVQLLADLDVPFDRTHDGWFDLTLEGGHSRHRVAHDGDHSGATITAAMAATVRRTSSVQILENHTATTLLATNSSINGIVVRGPDGVKTSISTDRIVLATGGLGGLWPHTTNPRTALGQGVALATRAGARTDDLHLVQFHPTGLAVPHDPMPLLSEALRGAGATLLANGKRFVDELQPRDVVAVAVWEQLRKGRTVGLDARAIHHVTKQFPSIHELTRALGLELTTDLLPVRPTLHYSMGGVTVDADARTTLPGLWAIGEVSRTGLHGANRLASNSLLEAVATGRAAAADATTWTGAWPSRLPAVEVDTIRDRRPPGRSKPIQLHQVRAILGSACGVRRDGNTLATVVDRLAPHTDDDVAYVGWLIARSALHHPRSVGAHWRTDDSSSQRVSA